MSAVAAKLVARVAELLAGFVARVSDLVGEGFLAVRLAPAGLRVRFGVAIPALHVLGGVVHRVAHLVARVAEMLARLVAGVRDRVAGRLAVGLAPCLLGIGLGLSIALLDVIHGGQAPSRLWRCVRRT